MRSESVPRRLSEKLAATQVACKKRPSELRLWTLLGSLQEDAGELELAIGSFRKALQCVPLHCYAHTGIAGCLYKLGDYAGAESAYRLAVEIEPTAGRWIYLGVASSRLGRADEAEKCYQNAVALAPENDEAHYNLGVTYRENEPERALGHLDRAIAIDARYQLAHRERGFVLGILGRIEESIASLKKAIELNPEDYWCHLYMAAAYREISHYETALQIYQYACKFSQPGDATPHYFLGKYLATLKRHDEAIKTLQKAEQLDASDTLVCRELAACYEAIGDWESAGVYKQRAGNEY